MCCLHRWIPSRQRFWLERASEERFSVSDLRLALRALRDEAGGGERAPGRRFARHCHARLSPMRTSARCRGTGGYGAGSVSRG